MIRKNLYILLTLASVFSFAQVNLYSEVNTKEGKMNSPLVFTVVLEIFGEDLVQETPVKLPDFSKFDYEFASEQNTFIDPVKKIRINQMVYQFSLAPKQIGNIKIGSALVKINGKIYKTEPIDIIVKEADKKALASGSHPMKNMYINLQVQEKNVYKDEPVIAILRAFSKNISGFRHLETSKFGYSKNFAIRSIANFDESIEDSENNYSSQVVGMFVVIPKVVGIMDIPSAEIPVSGHQGSLVSNKVKINVKKLPEGAPSGFRDAVGKYNLSVELMDKSKENFEINKAFNVAVKVSGSGNLSPSILPKILPSSDYETFEPKIVNNSKATTDGITGQIEAQYVVIPKRRGDIRITTEDFSYFDPSQEKYIDLGSKSLMLNAVNSQDIANAKSTLQKVNEYTNSVLNKVDSPVMSTKTLQIKEHKKINWFGILGNLLIVGIVSGILIYVNKRYKEKKKKNLEKKNMPQKRIVNIEETEAMLRNEQATFDADSHFNYLQRMIDEGDTFKFYTSFDELKYEADRFTNEKFSMDFPSYLKEKIGQSQFDKYKELISKVSMEKYAPFSSKEKQLEILNDIKAIYKLL